MQTNILRVSQQNSGKQVCNILSKYNSGVFLIQIFHYRFSLNWFSKIFFSFLFLLINFWQSNSFLNTAWMAKSSSSQGSGFNLYFQAWWNYNHIEKAFKDRENYIIFPFKMISIYLFIWCTVITLTQRLVKWWTVFARYFV